MAAEHCDPKLTFGWGGALGRWALGPTPQTVARVYINSSAELGGAWSKQSPQRPRSLWVAIHSFVQDQQRRNGAPSNENSTVLFV